MAADGGGRSHPTAPLLDKTAIKELLARPLGNTSSVVQRAGLEHARSLGAWVKEYNLALEL